MTCMKTVALKSQETVSGLKGYVALGTCLMQGEEVTCRGRVSLYLQTPVNTEKLWKYINIRLLNQPFDHHSIAFSCQCDAIVEILFTGAFDPFKADRNLIVILQLYCKVKNCFFLNAFLYLSEILQ